MAKSTTVMLQTIVLGVLTQVREYRESSQNSQPFAVTGISSTYYGRIKNFRLRTLGVHKKLRKIRSRLEVRTSTSRHHDVCVCQIQHLHWEFQCNFVSSENILEIPLTFSSKHL